MRKALALAVVLLALAAGCGPSYRGVPYAASSDPPCVTPEQFAHAKELAIQFGKENGLAWENLGGPDPVVKHVSTKEIVALNGGDDNVAALYDFAHGVIYLCPGSFKGSWLHEYLHHLGSTDQEAADEFENWAYWHWKWEWSGNKNFVRVTPRKIP
jgi:hypothetical protein